LPKRYFWGSPTEQQMKEVELQLFNLGWTPDQPTDDQVAMGEIIFEEMQKERKVSSQINLAPQDPVRIFTTIED
jgi:hypothetical protein